MTYSSEMLHSYELWQRKCNYCTKYLTKVALVMISTLAFVRQKTSQLYNYFTHPDTKAPLNPILGKALAAGYPLSAVAGKEGWLCELV